jgi:dipeptidyl-peptidase-4
MTARLRVSAWLSLAFAAVAATLSAQGQRMLSIDAIYDPGTRTNFNGTPPPDITWIDADAYVSAKRAAGQSDWVTVDAASGRESPLFDAIRMETALAALPGVSRDEAAARSHGDDLTLNPARNGALVTIADDLYYYDFATGQAARLTATPGEEEIATFSPNGRSVAFVRNNNLFVVDVAAHREVALTTDGSAELLNGKLDWLYQEEIYGRGQFRSYWWSPDSSRVAFLQLNEHPVPKYTVVDHIPYSPVTEITPYPKAGEPNPLVRLGVARIAGGDPMWVNVGEYSAIDLLIVDVGWAPNARDVAFQVQNREQTWLDFDLADAASGETRKVLHETTKAWVDNFGSATWLKDGSFLWLSARNGFKHLYHYKTDGTLLGQVTTGRWDFRTLYGVDESKGLAYFSAGEHRHIDTDIYSVRLDGTGMTRLSQTAGTHRASFNPTYTQYVDFWNDVSTPTQARLYRADGRDVRVIEANQVKAFADYRLPQPEFIEVKTRDGFPMDGMIIKPPDFNPSKKYPVYQFTYAGPTAAVVRNRWAGSDYLFHQLLAQSGVIVWLLDNRSAGGKGGAEAQWPVYGDLGEPELRDLEDGITWLKQQPYVDASRIVLSGWSYGGFMTAYALTHSTSWAGGIVGAPVTDWRDYDSVYTDRLMKMPQNNPEGYRKTAPRNAVANLHGQMLLMHGEMDDNVHMQNSIQFAYDLQRAGKAFEMMVYAKSRHGFDDALLIKHRQQTMYDFVLRTVGVTAKPAPGASSR